MLRDRISGNRALARSDTENLRILALPEWDGEIAGISPLNERQRVALELLLDDEVRLVTLGGKAGTGKTLLAIAAGLRRTCEDKKYARMLVTRPDRDGALLLPPIADDAFLFMWRVSAMVPEAYELVRAMDFNHKSEIVWNKLTKHGKKAFGMGRTVRGSHESCIIAKRGRPRRLSGSIRSTFEAPVGEHSEKPDAFYALVEALCGGPRLEVFGRKARPGWTVIGDQAPGGKLLEVRP